jgi:hypothetical protein
MSSQFAGRHSRPGHYVALSVEEKQHASSCAPEAQVQLLVICRDDLTRQKVSARAFEDEMIFLDIIGHKIRLLLLEVFAVAADGRRFGFRPHRANQNHEQE